MKFEPILAIVPKDKDVARFPVIAKNYTEIDMEVNPRLPVYRLTAHDRVLCQQSSDKHEEELLAAFKFPDIHPDQLQKLKKLILEYSDVFALKRVKSKRVKIIYFDKENHDIEETNTETFMCRSMSATNAYTELQMIRK